LHYVYIYIDNYSLLPADSHKLQLQTGKTKQNKVYPTTGKKCWVSKLNRKQLQVRQKCRTRKTLFIFC